MDPVEVLCHVTGLVALKGTNEVPAGVDAHGLRLLNLLDALLHIVFAEISLARLPRLCHGLNRFGLAHRNKAPGGMAQAQGIGFFRDVSAKALKAQLNVAVDHRAEPATISNRIQRHSMSPLKTGKRRAALSRIARSS